MVEWRIFHKDVTSSTNDDAAKGSHGDVFTAGFQTAGRGRGDHVWEGEKNAALMMSAVLATGGCSPAYVATFPLVAGLATMEGLRRLAGPALLLDIGIKWPNDVLCGGRKVAGLLCRREDERIVAGIGVNVKQKSFPKAIAGRAGGDSRSALAPLRRMASRRCVGRHGTAARDHGAPRGGRSPQRLQDKRSRDGRGAQSRRRRRGRDIPRRGARRRRRENLFRGSDFLCRDLKVAVCRFALFRHFWYNIANGQPWPGAPGRRPLKRTQKEFA